MGGVAVRSGWEHVSWGSGNGTLFLRRAGGQGRALAGRLLQWDRPSLIQPRDAAQEPFYEWFARGSVRMPPGRKPGLYVNHSTDGGHRVGHVEALHDGPIGPEALLLVEDGPIGDVVLENIDPDGSGLGLSIGFNKIDGGTVRDNRSFPPGLQRRAVWLTEVAFTDLPAFPEARLWMRGEPGAVGQALAGMGRRRYL